MTMIMQFFYRRRPPIQPLHLTRRLLLTSGGEVRVRFAPSPTGKLHLGGLRTALYNYLFAKKHNGLFLLRIEDTDQERLKRDSVDNIVESLRWTGIEADYGPHRKREDDAEQGAPWLQSQRLHLYAKYAEQLLAQGKAYKCFCDETRLNLLRRNAQRNQEKLKYDGKCRHLTPDAVRKYVSEGRKYVIRFKLPDRDVTYEDMIGGKHTSNPGAQEGDFILVKSDHYPTYHFANVVDDHLMRISHVMRGQEWQLSTAKHILLYEAFGWRAPAYGHLPLIFNADGTKISKRQNDIDVLAFRERTFMPETLLAYLCSIGGGLKRNALDDSSFLTEFKSVRQELLAEFDESLINSKPCKLDSNLLAHLNRRMLKLALGDTDAKAALVAQLRELLMRRNKPINEMYLRDDYLAPILEWSHDRVVKLDDLIVNDEFKFLWQDISDGNQDMLGDKLKVVELIDLMHAHFSANNSDIEDLNDLEKIKKDLSALFKKLTKSSNNNEEKKGPNNWQLVRFIFTGNIQGPPVAEIIKLLGKRTVVYRLNLARNYFLLK